MTGRSISISTVFDWTDYVPKSRNHSTNGRFFRQRKNTITKGEQEIMTGIYNNRTEGKKAKSLTDLLTTGTCHKDAWKTERKILVAPKETKVVSIAESEDTISNNRERTAKKINVYIPRAESPPHPPLPSPELTRKTSSSASSSSELWPTWEGRRSSRNSIPLKSVRINYCDIPRTPSFS
ncbi:unnamed protein product [Dimorphilus gyrociliatus]|uniref:Uncharacterized protein n=1 Tax=Dimorphilus gyrociliatus TaxID=2664684 RepID=A0A7I8VL28_9ANNE|nr:unnamed protein product [Dimorphilus gyrociliatus]